MQRTKNLPTILSLTAVLLIAGRGSAGAGEKKIRVVAAVPNLGSIASAIGADRAEVTTIAVGTQDAHFVDPKPSFIVKIRNADFFFVNGLDLEIGWVPPLIQGSRTARLLPGGPGYVDCSIGIPVVEVPASLSRAEGDVHPYGNPHYLTDPIHAEIVAATITRAFQKADPASSAFYEERRRAFVQRLHEAIFGKDLLDLAGGAKLSREAVAGTLDTFLDTTSVGGTPLRGRLGGWLGRMGRVRGRPLITYHKDYSYFAARFGLRVVDYVEPKPGIPPSARHLEELTERLRRGEAGVIVTRPFVEHRSTDLLAGKTGVKILTLPLEVGGAAEAKDYFSLFDFVTGQLSEALSVQPAAVGR